MISLERAAVTRNFLWNSTVFNRKHSYWTLIIIYSILFLLNLHYLLFFDPIQLKNCKSSQNHMEKQLSFICRLSPNESSTQKYNHFLTFHLSWMDFIINSLIPFIIILLANATVMNSVYKSHISIQNLDLRQTRPPRDTQLAYILFASTLLFVLLTFPLRVFSVIEPYLGYQEQYLILLDGFMRFLLYLDHGCGFYLYTFTGELFRREFKKFVYEFLFIVFRRRFSYWSSIESRRQSELSCSNNGGVFVQVSCVQPPLGVQQQTHGNVKLLDSFNNGATMKSSLYPLDLQKTFRRISYQPPNTYTNQHLLYSRSTSSSRTTLSPNVGPKNLFTSNINNNELDLVKRHSIHCFESEYQQTSMSRTSSNELDRKSAIV